MKTAAIIAEYNPFHNGHLYQLEETRKLSGADFILVIMSGDFVQRGTPAVVDKYTRARMALTCGADAVFELPPRFATASADRFAKAGVELAEASGVVDFLSFGAESRSIDDLKRAAALDGTGSLAGFAPAAALDGTGSLSDFIPSCSPDMTASFKSLVWEGCRKGMTCPAARARAYGRLAPDLAPSVYSSPNNILAIEYLKALRDLASGIEPLLVPRKGEDYHSTKEGIFSSATGIRKAMEEGRSFSASLPDSAIPILHEAEKERRLVFEKDLDDLLAYRLWQLISSDSGCLTDFQDVSPEIAGRIVSRFSDFRGFEDFSHLIKCKNMTLTGVRRALLHILLNMRQKDANQPVSYLRLLGFKKSAAPLLSEIKKRASLPLVTKAADARLLIEKDAAPSMLYQTLVSRKSGNPIKNDFNSQLVIIR